MSKPFFLWRHLNKLHWITLTAGILLLGIMIVYSVMNDSAGYLMDEFETLNAQYAADAVDVSALGQQNDLGQPNDLSR